MTAPEDEEVCCGSRKDTSWRSRFVDCSASLGVVSNVSNFGFFVVGAMGISMNLGHVPASTGSSFAGLCKRGRPGRFKCGEHVVKSIAFNAAGHPSCWFLETAYCSASDDSSCCAYQMLITEGVTSQPEACYPWLQKLIDICSWTGSENLVSGRISFL